MEQPEVLSVWRHLKTNSLYTVLGVSICSTNGNEDERAVIYLSHSRKMLHHRVLSEFMDGRFEYSEKASPSYTAARLMRMRDKGSDE